MKFVCYPDCEQLPESANELFAQAGRDSIFFSREWFESMAVALDDRSMVFACVLADNRVMAILPLVKSAGNTWYSLKHRYTPHYSLLLANDDQQQVLTCLVQGLGQLPLKALILEPVADDDSKLLAMQTVMEADGFNCDHMFRFYNWILRVQGQSYQEYLAARPSRLRNTMARKKRKLEREHGYDIRLFTGDDVVQAMADYYSVYSASWKAEEQYVLTLDDIVARFTRAGWTRLAILYIKGQPAAAQLWFVHHGKASIFRLSYDEAWKRYSTGSILTGFLMQYVIDVDKVEQVDFLTGNDAYKQDWMSDRRQRFALSCIKNVKPASSYERFTASLRRLLKTT